MVTIQDILKTNSHSLWMVAPDSTLDNAIKLMAEKKVEALPVLDSGELVGVISEKDCIEKVILKGKSTEETQVAEIMVRDPVYSSPAQTVEDCLDMMTRNQILYMPVMTGKSLVGFISMNDLFRTIITDQKAYIYRLENYVMGIEFAL